MSAMSNNLLDWAQGFNITVPCTLLECDSDGHSLSPSVTAPGDYHYLLTATPVLVQDGTGTNVYYVYCKLVLSLCPTQGTQTRRIKWADTSSTASIGVTAVSSGPQTTPSGTTSSTTTGWSVGGNFGFFGATPTGGLNGSYSMSSTTSVYHPSVTTSNRQDQWGKGVVDWYWDFDPSSAESSTTFTPTQEWIWEFPASSATKDAAGNPVLNTSTIVQLDYFDFDGREVWVHGKFPNTAIPLPAQTGSNPLPST